MSQAETWYTGQLSITPSIGQSLADALNGVWTVTTDTIECQDGQREFVATEVALLAIIKKCRNLGHIVTGEIDWVWDGDGHEFGQFVMIDNILHHRRGEKVLGAPEPVTP